MAGIEKYKSNTGFIDLLFNVLLGVFVLYWLSQLLINEPDSKKIDSIAQSLIIIEWPYNISSDIDLWVRDPQGKIVGYRTRDAGSMSLERDDLGHSNDTYSFRDAQGNMQEVVIQQNQETVTLRGYVRGEYQISLHYYRVGSDENNMAQLVPKVPVTVKLVRVNPSYRVIYTKTITMSKHGEEISAFQFEVDTDDGISGEVVSITQEDKYFVIRTQHGGVGATSPGQRGPEPSQDKKGYPTH